MSHLLDGIAPNVFLGKVGSDLQKPDGLTVITKDNLPEVLLGLELQDIYGIGERMEQRLHRAGILTVAQLPPLAGANDPKMSDLYFSDREQGPRPRTIEQIGATVWTALRYLIESRIEDGSFGYKFPEVGPTARVHADATAANSMRSRMRRYPSFLTNG